MSEKGNKEIVFVECAMRRTERFYCGDCFYYRNKIGLYSREEHIELLEKYPKPQGTKCYKGTTGFYKQL